MDTRRDMITKVLSTALGIGAAGVGAKVIDVPKDRSAFLVVTVPPDFVDPDDDKVARISARIEQITGLRALVFPHGTEVKAIASGMAYQRERLGEYEYEFVAETEEDLQDRLTKYLDIPDERGCGATSKPFSFIAPGIGTFTLRKFAEELMNGPETTMCKVRLEGELDAGCNRFWVSENDNLSVDCPAFKGVFRIRKKDGTHYEVATNGPFELRLELNYV